MVLGMDLEMLCKIRNLLAKNCYLYFRGSGICLVCFICIDNLCLSFDC